MSTTDAKREDDVEQRAKALAERIFGDPDSKPYRHVFDGQRWSYPNAVSYIKSALQQAERRGRNAGLKAAAAFVYTHAVVVPNRLIEIAAPCDTSTIMANAIRLLSTLPEPPHDE